MKQEKEFDRSICFTFYNCFHEQIMDVKRDFGLEQAFEVYEAIVNCGLYGTEIAKGKLRTLVGNATLERIENSQENRAKWFNGENFEQTRLVAEYMRDHPEASQRTIAAATGVGKTKVGKVQKNIRDSELDSIQDYLDHIVYPNLNINNSSNSNNDSDNNIVGEGETDQRDQSASSQPHTETASPTTESTTPAPPSPTELTYEEYTLLMNTWETSQGTGKSPSDIAKELNLDVRLCNQAVSEYKQNNYTRREKPKVVIEEIPLLNGGYLNRTKEELFNEATNNGKSLVEDVAWKELESGYIMFGLAPITAKQLTNDFKQKLKDLNDATVLQRAAN